VGGNDANEKETRQAVVSRDARELGWGMDEVIQAADLRIENAGGVTEFEKKARELLKEYTVLEYSILLPPKKR
jgi:hypothetical protein